VLFGYLLAVSATVCEDCAVEKTSNCPSGTVLYDCNDATSAGTAWIRKNAVSSYIGSNCWNGNWLAASTCTFVSGSYFCKYTCPVTYKRNETKREEEQTQYLQWSSMTDYFSTANTGPQGERVFKAPFLSVVTVISRFNPMVQYVRPFVHWARAAVRVSSTGAMEYWTWPVIFNNNPVYLGGSRCSIDTKTTQDSVNFVSLSAYPPCDSGANYGLIYYDLSQDFLAFPGDKYPWAYNLKVATKVAEWQAQAKTTSGCDPSTFDKYVCAQTGASQCGTATDEIARIIQGTSPSGQIAPDTIYQMILKYSPTTILTITV
jgi:hypothetical protein